ncbi:MAG: endonuclease III domain-containing protein [Spirochaetia bacterium]
MTCTLIHRIYEKLLALYGQRGWWPVITEAGEHAKGYVPGSYHHPVTKTGRTEVVVGAILTQNTTWMNVRKALANLLEKHLIDSKKLLQIDKNDLAQIIRSAGYYNQKAKKLKEVFCFFEQNHALETGIAPSRQALLELWGVGPETADSILLYGFHENQFVIDTYTKRALSRITGISDSVPYAYLKERITADIPKNTEIYKEYHALFVELGKHVCTKRKPKCSLCPVSDLCEYYRTETGLSYSPESNTSSPS